jgi:hypothetical protein
MKIKEKNGNSDLNGFQLIWLAILLFLFYWMIWDNGVQSSFERGDGSPPSQWDGFGACFVFTLMVYIFVKLCDWFARLFR